MIIFIFAENSWTPLFIIFAPVTNLPRSTMKKFCAKPINSHPMTKGTVRKSMLRLRPKASRAKPAKGHAATAPNCRIIIAI